MVEHSPSMDNAMGLFLGTIKIKKKKKNRNRKNRNRNPDFLSLGYSL